MLESLDFSAIIWGCGVAILLSTLTGVIFGAALAADNARTGDQPSPDDKKGVDKLFEADMRRRPVIMQSLVLSLAVAAVSGAVTVWASDSAPILNAAAVGLIGTLLSVALPMPQGMPRSLRYGGPLGTLPATLLGAWVMYI